MTTFSIASPLPSSAPNSLDKTVPAPARRKRVLLVDACTAKCQLRAEAMRKLGLDVDCAGDISEARAWWRANLYNLVLINIENDLGHRDKFCEDIRGAIPPQQVAFLVGKPRYVADLPLPEPVTSPMSDEARTIELPDVSGDAAVPWGIMAASRRISAVRSVLAARSTAIRNRPAPPRDLEVRDSRKIHSRYQPLLDLIKEDLS